MIIVYLQYIWPNVVLPYRISTFQRFIIALHYLFQGLGELFSHVKFNPFAPLEGCQSGGAIAIYQNITPSYAMVDKSGMIAEIEIL